MNFSATPVQILLVEDSPGDANLTGEALRGSKVASQVHVVSDGEAAMDYVRRSGDYAEAPRPDLILLDLNLPLKDGHQVLAELKDGPDLSTIPVVVLTTSTADKDVLDSYRLHANSFVSKPVELTGFLDAVRKLEGFWLTVVRLPPGGGEEASGWQ